ncbi:hydroxyacid dehydrogenase, partial [Methylobacterium organophilum]|nr:hydroxyacid dehydrogenase [Methylobacterium organophilum]
MTPTADLDTLLTALRDGLGARHVLTDPDGLAPYLTESRRLFTGSKKVVPKLRSVSSIVMAPAST